MALAQEDRHPITDIIRQTPEIPENCQWAIFLRNHDELTLEMVTEEERDYLWRTYAADSRARLNLGIRRRLAPLMQNERRKIELMNALLLSMPGTPIIYYGDELGMGDNYYLGDRDGVRTPMQWSADRNAGFSRANPQELYLPPIMDSIYGYQAVNVESQLADPSSLLNWMRRMLSVRKQHAAFSRGTISFLYPRNRKMLAYVREYDDETILCVANLARSAQAVELDLARFRGRVPVELTGRSPFPPVGDLPYLLTLPAYGFFWFILTEEHELPSWHEPVPEPLPEFITLTARDGRVEAVLEGRERKLLESEILPQFLPLQRWFGGKDAAIQSVSIDSFGPVQDEQHVLAAVDVMFEEENQRYLLPLSARWGEENLRPGSPKLSYTLAKIRKGPRVGALMDAAYDESFALNVLDAMKSDLEISNGAGTVRFYGSKGLSRITNPGEPRPLAVEQSNVSIAFGDQVILKLYRRLRPGEQPDVEVARFLTEVADFAHTPQYLGRAVAESGDAPPTALAAAFAFVPNQGDAWNVVLEALQRDLEQFSLQVKAEGGAGEAFTGPLALGGLLGQRTAELHRALATETDRPAFESEPVTKQDLTVWSNDAVKEARATLSRLKSARETAACEVANGLDELLERKDDLMARLEAAATLPPSGRKTRIHGDYHLGQVLVAQNDFVIIDFEGEPRRPLEERSAKMSPLRDVAGMLRSFDYAAAMALKAHAEAWGELDSAVRERTQSWHDSTRDAFLTAYREHIAGAPSHPDPHLEAALLDLFVLQKAVYEIAYELANRPAWLNVPLQGILGILESKE
jgi:maltose alpha-D-glucosyltransferase/alpha-amylase